MIGHIRGILIEKQPPQLVVEANGVGYEIEASMQTFYQLTAILTELKIDTHFVVREDAQLLFGFYDKTERALFRVLIKASGVGPKLAIAILSGMSTAEFSACVLREDSATLTKIPGVGKKTNQYIDDAQSALVALGYKPVLATKSVAAAHKKLGQVNSSEELIRESLKSMVG